MLLNVKSRSPESWGPLASIDEDRFDRILNNRRGSTKEIIKDEVKQVKKLKTYKVTFRKEWSSDAFLIQAESDWDVSSAASMFFKENQDKIGFKEKPRPSWASEYRGYDSVSYVKVKSADNK